MSMDFAGEAAGRRRSCNRGRWARPSFPRSTPRIARRFFAFVRPYKTWLASSLLAVVVFVASQVSIPICIRLVVDTVAGKPDAPKLDVVVAFFFVIILVNAVASFLQEWLAARLAQRVIFDLRRAMFAHIEGVSLSFFDKAHVGSLMSRLQGDVNALQEFLETSVSAIGDFVLLFGVIAVLLWMSLELGLLTLSVIPILVGVRAIWLPRAKAIFRRARDASSIVNGALAENIGGVRLVQGARREAVNLAEFDQKAATNFKMQVRSAWTAQILVPAVESLTGVAQAVVVVIGGWAVLAGRIDVGIMVAFLFYVQRFFDPIRTLSQQYTVMQRAMAAGGRIFEVLDVPVQIEDRADAYTPLSLDPTVEFRNATFGYKPGEPVLHDVSFKIPEKQVFAIVGPTGSGKTSIMSLTHRFYDVWKGEVRVGGYDVRDLAETTLSRTIAIVLQEPFLFTGTVLENIRYSTANASREDVIRAAKAVHAHDFIERLPKGYDTPLEQRGQNLSLGQRQLISFARALIANPKILILDEATASIDSFTELEIQKALKVLLKGRTCIIIAHRLATVRDADRILVLKKGRIHEQGSHGDLIAAGGLYADLYRKSYSSFDDFEATAPAR